MIARSLILVATACLHYAKSYPMEYEGADPPDAAPPARPYGLAVFNLKDERIGDVAVIQQVDPIEWFPRAMKAFALAKPRGEQPNQAGQRRGSQDSITPRVPITTNDQFISQPIGTLHTYQLQDKANNSPLELYLAYSGRFSQAHARMPPLRGLSRVENDAAFVTFDVVQGLTIETKKETGKGHWVICGTKDKAYLHIASNLIIETKMLDWIPHDPTRLRNKPLPKRPAPQGTKNAKRPEDPDRDVSHDPGAENNVGRCELVRLKKTLVRSQTA